MSSKASQTVNTSAYVVSHNYDMNHNKYDSNINSESDGIVVITAREKTLPQLLPNSVYAYTLHYLLQMCRITGLHLSAVNALDELIQLSERVQIQQ